MNNLLISQQLRDALIAYLSQRPFAEVEQPVYLLRSLREAPADESPSQEDAKAD